MRGAGLVVDMMSHSMPQPMPNPVDMRPDTSAADIASLDDHVDNQAVK
jgi:hypothetical protein